VIYERIFHTL